MASGIGNLHLINYHDTVDSLHRRSDISYYSICGQCFVLHLVLRVSAISTIPKNLVLRNRSKLNEIIIIY